jgi:hypothetical protein
LIGFSLKLRLISCIKSKKNSVFFPEGNDDAVWIEKMQDPLWELYDEVQINTNVETLKQTLSHFLNT